MKKILFIVPYPPGEAPSQRFRFEQYFEILNNHDYTIEISAFWSLEAWQILYTKGHRSAKAGALLSGLWRRFLLLFKIHGFQTIFIHREAAPVGPPVIEYLLTHWWKKRVIYDFDDAIWQSNTSSQNQLASKFKYHNKVQNICTWSTLVSCGNQYLADYAMQFNSHVVVNPTTIDTTYHKTKKTNAMSRIVTVGWTGTHSTTKYLTPLVPVLKKLIGHHPVRILIISDQRPAWKFRNYDFIKWNKADEIQQLDQIDIGIMPLADTPWEQGKCGFKALQYMAMEIPAVASPVGVNTQLICHGKNGYLCDQKNAWHEVLSRLVTSASLRREIGKNGRETVENDYSVISNSDRFVRFFE